MTLQPPLPSADTSQEKKLHRLERLSQISAGIMSQLGVASLEGQLDLIARDAAEILEAEACGVSLVRRPGVLSLEASFGHRPGGFIKGLELPIRSAPKGGLSGHIAFEGQLFNAHGQDLTSHFAVRNIHHAHLPSGRCHSLLAIPLMKKTSQEQALIGLIRAENKKDPSGQASSDVYFTAEDEWILKLFAELAVAAIESAGLVEQIAGQREQLSRLVESSPDGIVSTDPQGCITGFNSRASEILGYRPEELLGRHYSLLLWEPATAVEIERLLEQPPDGRLDRFKTFARAKAPDLSHPGEKVSVSLSAARLYSPSGENLGSVGYFEDLRPMVEAETQRQILLDGIEAVGRAETLHQGLHSLAEKIVAACHATFCHILLLTADGDGLVVKAAYPVARQTPLDWLPGFEKIHLNFNQFDFKQILRDDQPVVFQDSNEAQRPLLGHLAGQTRLKGQLRSALVVPFKAGSTPLGVVVVAEMRSWERSPFNTREIELTRSLAAQAAVLIEKMRLHELTSQRLEEITHHERQLSLLYRISDMIQSAGDLPRILRVVLTGITAGYGLGLNRAALFRLNEQRNTLEGWMGIGHITQSSAEKDWKRHHHKGLEDFDRFLKEMETGHIPLTPLERRVQGLSLPIHPAGADLLSQAVLTRQPALIASGELNLPRKLVSAFQPALPLAVIPLLARERVIGLLVVDNKFTSAPITDEMLEMLRTFANSAAVAIDNHSLIGNTILAHEKINSAFQASLALVSSHQPGHVLEDIVRQMEITSGATWVSIILADRAGRLHDFYTTDRERTYDWQTNLQQIIRPNGYTMQVMRTGHPVVIENTHKQRHPPVNRQMYYKRVDAAVCLPILHQGQRIGAIWVHYDHPRHFEQFELEALQLYVNQAAIAYTSAQRMEELDLMREAAVDLANARGQPEVLKRALVNAAHIFQADSTALWSYDEARRRFIADASLSIGIPQDAWQHFQDEEVQPGQTASQVLLQGWVGVEDVTDAARYPYLGQSTRRLLEQIGVKSFQGILLSAGDERLGVLYVNYNTPRVFRENDQETARTYSQQAAMALQAARLHQQVSEARNAANMVAVLTTLGDLSTTLEHIVEDTRKVLDCDVVTLYTYAADQQRFLYPPKMVGVWNPAGMLRYDHVAKDSIIYQILEMDKIYVTEDTRSDPVMSVSFAHREEIVATVGIPLKTHERKVGVMFVNFRRPHHFTQDEITNILLFSNQAAVAIYNAQLYQEIHRRAEALNALYEAGKAVTSTLTLDEALRRVCEQALKVIGRNPQDESCFSHVAFREGNQLHFIAASTPGVLTVLRRRVGVIDLDSGTSIGVAGRAARDGQTQLVDDIRQDPDFICCDSQTSSQLSVVLKIGQRQIGVLSIEHPEVKAFSLEDVQSVELLAAQAAVSIDNARQYNQLQVTLAELRQTRLQVDSRSALALMSMATNQWRHIIEGHAINITNNVTLLRQELEGLSAGQPIPASLEEKLDRIENLALMIEAKPITPPLSSEEGLADILIHDLIYERLYQLWANEPYRSVQHEILFKTEYAALVRASSEWLRRAFDIIIDNAVDELQNVPKEQRCFTVTTRQAGELLEIEFSDTGRGIPEEVQRQLFHKRVEKNGGQKGLGIGLLMAQVIIETYNGTISIQPNQPTGTKVIVRLPFWQSPYIAE